MPIYEYRCAACGFQKEYLQKVSDPQLTQCPDCGKDSFKKMLTAAGFQLKGSGWYATDFKNGGSKSGDSKSDSKDGGSGGGSGGDGDKGTKSLQSAHTCMGGACCS
jgi:putative FmdB family regulatory protein